MKIVVLDGFTENSGDLTWNGLTELGEVTVYDRTAPEEIVGRASDAEVVLTNKVIIDRAVVEQLPRLRYIGVLATGYNVVDLGAAKERGIVVTNIPAYSTMSVAQMVFAHILNITNQVVQHSHQVMEGRWQKSPDFCFYDKTLMELDGKTLGIVGVGNTGKAVARIASAMGMRVIALSSKSADALNQMGIEKVRDRKELFCNSDIVSLHCPLTEDTRHIVCKETLSLMKPSAILINTGRGPLVDEQALADALNNGLIQAAGVDVLEQEPPRNGSPLIGAKNCYITPHIAWATLAARQRLMDIAVANVKAFCEGKPQNVVN